jgi:hypothetical protein
MFRKLLLVALFLALATDVTISTGVQEGAHLRRELKKNNDGNANGNNNVPFETGQCVLFESDAVQAAKGYLGTDDACMTNTCPGGCCRFFNYLECDDLSANLYPQLRVSTTGGEIYTV